MPSRADMTKRPVIKETCPILPHTIILFFSLRLCFSHSFRTLRSVSASVVFIVTSTLACVCVCSLRPLYCCNKNSRPITQAQMGCLGPLRLGLSWYNPAIHTQTSPHIHTPTPTPTHVYIPGHPPECMYKQT